MIPAWLLSAQPPLRTWLGLLVRMTIGVFITTVIVVLLKLPSEPAAWAVVAVVVVMGFTAGASSIAAINRLQGSVVGCLTGAITQLIFGEWLWLPFVAAISVGLSLIFCRLLRIGAGFRLGAALAGFFVFVPGNEEWLTVWYRLLATGIGVAIAIIIMLVIPSHTDEKVRNGSAGGLSDSLLIVDAAFNRWLGQPDPEGLDAARARVKAGTNAVAAAVSERSRERGGAWEPDVYSELVSDLNDAMITARRIDRVSQFRDSDKMYQYVGDPFANQLQACTDAGQLVIHLLQTGKHDELHQLEAAAVRLAEVPAKIKEAIEDLRSQHRTPNANAEELQRLFGIALLMEHWADAIHNLTNDLAAAQN